MSLEQFGQKLRELRKSRGFTQAALARQVSVSPQLISIWERAYKHRNRQWKPDRPSVLCLVEIFVDQLSPEEAQTWVSLIGYKLGQTDLQKFFPLYSVEISTHADPPPDFQTNLKRLALLPEERLFGVSQEQKQLCQTLQQPDAPWLVAIDGIGGIGKTSLAGAATRELMSTNRFYDLAWVSAKQEEFLPSLGLQPASRPALDTDTLVNALLEQLDPRFSLACATQERTAHLTGLLKKQPYLIVIDNLETIVDYQTLLPWLRQIVKPSKCLLTSRHYLQGYADVYCLSLKELNRTDTLALLRNEAEVQGLSALANASNAQLESIYEVVGGNPLALKLVVGQICVFSLTQVLEHLKQAQGKTVEELYSFIYWQAWQALSLVGQKVLLIMPLAQDGTIDQLLALSRVEPTDFSEALQQLVTLSLVQVGGNLTERRYSIHRLTETFLLNEAIKWNSLT